MPFCPKCHYEYKDDVQTCPDCNLPLVANLDAVDREADDPDADRKWVALAKLTSQQHAEMLIEALRAKDIPAVLESDSGFFGMTGQMGPSSFQPVGDGFVIHVDVDKVVEANAAGAAIVGESWEASRLVDFE